MFDLSAALPDDGREAFFEIVTRHVAYKDPAPVAAAISAKAESPFAPEYAGALVETWAKDGLHAPSRWLADLPPGPVRDAGTVALVEELAPHDVEAAREWANSIGDEEARSALLEGLAP